MPGFSLPGAAARLAVTEIASEFFTGDYVILAGGHPWRLPWKYFAPRRSLLSKTNPIRPAAAVARNSNLSELSSIT